MVSPVAEAFLCEDLDSPLIAEKGDVYGEGVNVAARLQAYAEPGDVIVSQVVAEKLQPQARTGAIDLGELPLRNMQKPVRVYALRPDPAAASPQRLGEAGADEEARPSIALLPFRTHHRDGESDNVALGVVDAIAHGLSGLKDLFVISRGSTLSFANGPADPVDVGRRLGVRYILSGGVLRGGNRLRINTELTDAHGGTVVYSEHHDGALDDLFNLQDRIALRL
jgi:adenylate cyclase